ncbi:hypothetical protein CI610_00259 [invertebrate metagenome]|uniref:HD/PDEase domain-containing protein n=1 Tax=invertebrate metagenome TaxID=1711999 RepID=A0A2H9TBZ8_9ZZZZ
MDTCQPASTNLLSSWEHQFQQFFSQQNISDASHDLSHFQRVWKTAQLLLKIEQQPANSLTILAACYFHDIVVLPKNHPDRSKASRLAADKAITCLQQLQFPSLLYEGVHHAILAHSFSAQILPETREAKIVQDADRMEALGAIGLARVFYTSGLLKQKMFDSHDPLAKQRPLDDKQYALDHFQLKLFNLAETMQTEAGRILAQKQTNILKLFVKQLSNEIIHGYSL